MKLHANSHENDADHHLYEIFDVERNSTFKFGICGKSFNADGSSPRANEQVGLYNRVVGMNRFFAKVIVVGISGRKQAEILEAEYVAAFREENGHNPVGNL